MSKNNVLLWYCFDVVSCQRKIQSIKSKLKRLTSYSLAWNNMHVNVTFSIKMIKTNISIV